MTISWKSNFNWYITRQTAPIGQHHVTNDFRFNSSNTDCSVIYKSNKQAKPCREQLGLRWWK